MRAELVSLRKAFTFIIKTTKIKTWENVTNNKALQTPDEDRTLERVKTNAVLLSSCLSSEILELSEINDLPSYLRK